MIILKSCYPVLIIATVFVCLIAAMTKLICFVTAVHVFAYFAYLYVIKNLRFEILKSLLATA